MKIERVDDKTVKCYLSNEELEEYDIDYKDFLLRSEKAKEVVQEIIEQAAEEVGYRPPKFAFDLQIMMLPDQGLLLTFSEREPEGDHLAACLKEMKRFLQLAREQAGLGGGSQGNGGNPVQEQQEEAEEEPGEGKKPELAVFAFGSLGNVMTYAAALPANLRVDSRLFEMNGIYYLELRKGHAAYERYSRACIQAMEFGSLYAAQEQQVLALEEHGTCLIGEKAVRKLRG